MIVYVNGDSYPCLSDGKRYSEFLAEYYSCDVLNNSIRGSCNSRIFRTSLRDLIDLKNQNYNNIKAIISLSFVIRTELWDETIKNNKFINDGEFTSIQPVSGNNWFNNKLASVNSDYKEFCKQFLYHYNIEAEITKLLQNIILFSSWCKVNNVDYVIFSGPLQEPIDLTAPFVKSFYDIVSTDNNVLNLFEFSFTEWCLNNNFIPITKNLTQEIHGKTYNVGHHGESAHRAFAEFLFENYLK